MLTEKGWTVLFWVVAALMLLAVFGFFGGGDPTGPDCVNATYC